MDGLEQHGVISFTLGLFLETKRRDPSSFHGLQLDCYFMGVGGGDIQSSSVKEWSTDVLLFHEGYAEIYCHH